MTRLYERCARVRLHRALRTRGDCARQALRSMVATAALITAACGSSPTAPTPPPIVNVPPPVVVVPPPPVVTPPTPPPAPVFPPNDPRFDLTFYRKFVHDGYESPTHLYSQVRQAVAPRIYLRTIHANGQAIDAATLDATAAALINTTGSLTGVFGLAGLEMGTGTRAGQPGWITVSWVDDPERRFCGRGAIGGDWIDLYTNTPGCRCAGGPAIRLNTIKHELGHALGFYHTGDAQDLMSGVRNNNCDQNPSSREVYHAALAYTRPIGSPAP